MYVTTSSILYKSCYDRLFSNHQIRRKSKYNLNFMSDSGTTSTSIGRGSIANDFLSELEWHAKCMNQDCREDIDNIYTDGDVDWSLMCYYCNKCLTGIQGNRPQTINNTSESSTDAYAADNVPEICRDPLGVQFLGNNINAGGFRIALGGATNYLRVTGEHARIRSPLEILWDHGLTLVQLREFGNESPGVDTLNVPNEQETKFASLHKSRRFIVDGFSVDRSRYSKTLRIGYQVGLSFVGKLFMPTGEFGPISSKHEVDIVDSHQCDAPAYFQLVDLVHPFSLKVSNRKRTPISRKSLLVDTSPSISMLGPKHTPTSRDLISIPLSSLVTEQSGRRVREVSEISQLYLPFEKAAFSRRRSLLSREILFRHPVLIFPTNTTALNGQPSVSLNSSQRTDIKPNELDFKGCQIAAKYKDGVHCTECLDSYCGSIEHLVTSSVIPSRFKEISRPPGLGDIESTSPRISVGRTACYIPTSVAQFKMETLKKRLSESSEAANSGSHFPYGAHRDGTLLQSDNLAKSAYPFIDTGYTDVALPRSSPLSVVDRQRSFNTNGMRQTDSTKNDRRRQSRNGLVYPSTSSGTPKKNESTREPPFFATTKYINGHMGLPLKTNRDNSRMFQLATQNLGKKQFDARRPTDARDRSTLPNSSHYSLSMDSGPGYSPLSHPIGNHVENRNSGSWVATKPINPFSGTSDSGLSGSKNQESTSTTEGYNPIVKKQRGAKSIPKPPKYLHQENNLWSFHPRKND